jgi:hypothetical protein
MTPTSDVPAPPASHVPSQRPWNGPQRQSRHTAAPQRRLACGSNPAPAPLRHDRGSRPHSTALDPRVRFSVKSVTPLLCLVQAPRSGVPRRTAGVDDPRRRPGWHTGCVRKGSACVADDATLCSGPETAGAVAVRARPRPRSSLGRYRVRHGHEVAPVFGRCETVTGDSALFPRATLVRLESSNAASVNPVRIA